MTREEATKWFERMKEGIFPFSGEVMSEICDKAIKALSENKGEWIPVSERLPEEHKEVLTCSLGGFIAIQSIELNYWENQHGDWSDMDEVIAWQPLPEPYKAESEE